MSNENTSKTGKIFVISAPSGAGKTTVSQEVLKLCSQHKALSKVITYTSRSPRPREIDGMDYNFLSQEEFKRRQQAGFFLETTEYAGNFYGSPASIIDDLEAGKSYLMVTDRPGALVIKKIIPKAILIWLYVSDIDTLRQRLEKRGADTLAIITKRLKLAEQEMKLEDQEQVFDFHIKNENFDMTVAKVKKIIEQASDC